MKFRRPNAGIADRREGDRHGIPGVVWRALAKGTRVRLAKRKGTHPCIAYCLTGNLPARESMASENCIDSVSNTVVNISDRTKMIIEFTSLAWFLRKVHLTCYQRILASGLRTFIVHFSLIFIEKFLTDILSEFMDIFHQFKYVHIELRYLLIYVASRFRVQSLLINQLSFRETQLRFNRAGNIITLRKCCTIFDL